MSLSSIAVLIMGESGSGKSASLRNMKEEETFIIAAVDKPLPFKNKYKKEISHMVCDNYRKIIEKIWDINSNQKHIKSIIIDDFQYIMANEYMRRAKETGYNKFTDLAKNTWDILQAIQNCRPDLTFFMLTHSELTDDGKYRAKTIGKMLNEKVTLEGMFTIVLHAMILDGKYKLLTQNDGSHIAKSPIGMFQDEFIDNDLAFIKKSIDTYYADDIDDYDNYLDEKEKATDYHIKLINEAVDEEDLKIRYLAALKEEKKYKDRQMKAEFIVAKDERKKQLGI